MALTNAMLKSFGLETDQRDAIMAEHQATLESIKAERDELRDKAAKVPDLEKQIGELKAEIPTEDWKAKYDELKGEYDGFKEKVETEKAEQEKASLYRSMLREAGVDEKRLDLILKVTDLGKLSVKDGAIENAEAVKEAITSEWGGFITQKSTHGAAVDDPPSKSGAKMTRDEIMAIKDTSARQQAIAENIDQFR